MKKELFCIYEKTIGPKVYLEKIDVTKNTVTPIYSDYPSENDTRIKIGKFAADAIIELLISFNGGEWVAESCGYKS